MVSIGRTYRAWLLVAALGLAASAPKDGPQQPQYKTSPAQEAETQKSRSAPAPTLKQNAVKAHTTTSRDKADPNGQPNNDLANIAAVSTIVQAVTSVLGLIGLALTVIFAAKAWQEAKRSADAAHKTLVQDAKQSVHELRAYVFPVVTEISGRIAASAPLPTIKVGFENSGQTPAYDVRTSAAVIFAPPDFIPDVYSREDIVNVLAPGGNFTKEIRSNDYLSEHEFAGIVLGQMTLVLFGYIKYRSFGKERYSYFKSRYDMSGPEPTMIICPTGNHADEEAYD